MYLGIDSCIGCQLKYCLYLILIHISPFQYVVTWCMLPMNNFNGNSMCIMLVSNYGFVHVYYPFCLGFNTPRILKSIFWTSGILASMLNLVYLHTVNVLSVFYILDTFVDS